MDLILGTMTLFLSSLCFAAESSSKRSPSYYYEECAPTICGSSVVQFPIGLNPLCRSALMSSSCDNGSVFIRDDEAAPRKYKVLDDLTPAAYSRRRLTLVDVSLLGCAPIPPFYDQAWLSWVVGTNFHITSNYSVGTFFNCTRPPEASILAGMSEAPCLECGDSDTANLCYYYQGVMDKIPNCRPFTVLVPKALANNFTAAGNLRRKLQEGFEVSWDSACGTDCTDETGGRCGFLDEERRMGSEICFCTSALHQTSCSDGTIISLRGSKSKKKLVIAGLGIGTTILVLSVCCAYVRRCNRMKKKSESRGQDEETLRKYLEDKNLQAASIEAFLDDYTGGMPVRFSYKQIKKYSHNFSEKLGQGGFGSVFKAVLPNGCLVAVKLLDEKKQSKTQFLNEVRTLGRIHHNNLVRLLGFCFQKSRRALVYEFMENGSLEKYIHRKNRALSWNQLYDIALGTARGIAYLHEECQIRILHCDIKPHNILLDRKFQPKVSDFGLAQLLNKERSHVTLSGGRGTPGYAPPEMWWKKYGPITEKSDVYSFGMVVLEMVGGRRNFDEDASRPSKMYFPEWIYRHHVLHNGHASVGNGDSSIAISQWQVCEEEEEEVGDHQRIIRTLELVGLWCIQYFSAKRPSMRKAVQMLEGSVAIEIPPVPFNAALSQFDSQF